MTTPHDEAAVTAFALALPGQGPRLPGGLPVARHTPEEAHLLLGRKGLLAKEPATRLALCAAHLALGLPPGRPASPPPAAERTAVVVSSHLGNVHSVRRAAHAVRHGSYRDISPLSGPNMSANVIAATIALRYGLTGPNLTVCSGTTSGLAALRLAVLLLRASRAERVVVVGVEPDDATARALRAAHAPAGHGTRHRAQAACVIIEPAATRPRTDALLLGRFTRHGSRPPALPAPDGSSAARPDSIVPPPPGPADDADGVVRAAVAAAWLRGCAGSGWVRVTSGDHADGYVSALLRRPGQADRRRKADRG
ncbi:beta-ketoacyl synthase N-terminal-like domain-containing protein [Streptomyces sp. NPDC018045]|uniref:beta-ketoacyl synthase N-terminal-like domain-containing protein n=1 Tax=Streptomyces sp. NPDC018045 TaxID=3365037 RepID=UPI0037899A79